MSDIPGFTPMSQRQRTLLLSRWNRTAHAFMHRDGNNKRFTDGGHRIKSDPLLTAAILEIRDEYYNLFDEKRFLYQHMDMPEFDRHLRDVHYDMIALNNASVERLKQPDFGFSAERKAQILQQAGISEPPAPQQLPIEERMNILGTIIKKSIASFYRAFASEQVPEIGVPAVLKAPEEAGYRRSRPKGSDGQTR